MKPNVRITTTLHTLIGDRYSAVITVDGQRLASTWDRTAHDIAAWVQGADAMARSLGHTVEIPDLAREY